MAREKLIKPMALLGSVAVRMMPSSPCEWWCICGGNAAYMLVGNPPRWCMMCTKCMPPSMKLPPPVIEASVRHAAGDV